MISFHTPNKFVACTPLGRYRDLVLKGNTFKTAEQKGALLELIVVYRSGPADTEQFTPADKVYIRGECMTLPWSKEEFELEAGRPFILVPMDRIQLHGQVFESAAMVSK